MNVWIIEVIPFGTGTSYTFLGSRRLEAEWLKNQLKQTNVKHKIFITRGWKGELGVKGKTEE
jgi:hypothetical protein